MTNIHTFTLQTYNKLSHLAKLSHMAETISQVLLGINYTTLDIIEANSDTSNVAFLDSTEVKTFYKRAFRPE